MTSASSSLAGVMVKSRQNTSAYAHIHMHIYKRLEPSQDGWIHFVSFNVAGRSHCPVTNTWPLTSLLLTPSSCPTTFRIEGQHRTKCLRIHPKLIFILQLNHTFDVKGFLLRITTLPPSGFPIDVSIPPVCDCIPYIQRSSTKIKHRRQNRHSKGCLGHLTVSRGTCPALGAATGQVPRMVADVVRVGVVARCLPDDT